MSEMEAPVSTKTSVSTLLTNTLIDEEDNGDGFFFETEVSPPRYLPKCFFGWGRCGRDVRSRNKNNIAEHGEEATSGGRQIVDQHVVMTGEERLIASVAVERVDVIATMENLLYGRPDG